MDWFSFLAGALTGWIVEWLFDLFYWRRKQGRWTEEKSRMQVDLTQAQEVATGLRSRELDLSRQLTASRGDLDAVTNNAHLLQGELDSAQAQIEALKKEIALAANNRQVLADELSNELAAVQAELAAVRGQRDEAQVERLSLQAENAALQARVESAESEVQSGATRLAALGGLAAVAAAAEAPAVRASDDLTIIEGIGPKIAELLNQHEIYTFAELADRSVPELETILREGGNRFQTANPETWPRQARLAANRDWPRLDMLKAQLKGGVRAPEGAGGATRSQSIPAPQPPDDLAVIEGIGPKIAEILVQNGIRTFAQLARMEPARLRLLLNEAGPAYRIADPTSWPEQASWAAVGNWERLQALKEELNAGRQV